VSAPGDGGSREAPPDRGAAAAAHSAVLRRLRVRVPLMALGMLALLSALAGGLARLGWPLPVSAPLVAFHGPLMVAGFLGTVIGLERAVALGRSWAYGGPIASGLGALALAAGVPGGTELPSPELSGPRRPDSSPGRAVSTIKLGRKPWQPRHSYRSP